MKKFILAIMGVIVLSATACQKEQMVKPSHKVNGQVMDTDPADSGTTDPTLPPPHGN